MEGFVLLLLLSKMQYSKLGALVNFHSNAVFFFYLNDLKSRENGGFTISHSSCFFSKGMTVFTSLPLTNLLPNSKLAFQICNKAESLSFLLQHNSEVVIAELHTE